MRWLHEFDATGLAFRRHYCSAEKAGDIAFCSCPQFRTGILHAGKRADKVLTKGERLSAEAITLYVDAGCDLPLSGAGIQR